MGPPSLLGRLLHLLRTTYVTKRRSCLTAISQGRYSTRSSAYSPMSDVLLRAPFRVKVHCMFLWPRPSSLSKDGNQDAARSHPHFHKYYPAEWLKSGLATASFGTCVVPCGFSLGEKSTEFTQFPNVQTPKVLDIIYPDRPCPNKFGRQLAK